MPSSPPAQEQAGWEASLALDFERRDDRTVLARRRHRGPLTVQRPFYPETDGTCHVYVLHPPGGVVGGDQLNVEVSTTAGARALLTTPAATKFYRSAGRTARQTQHLSVGAGSRLEYLPQESIVYDRAEVMMETRVDLEADAELVCWDLLCLGRPSAGERFQSGRVQQRIEVFRDGEPILLERATYEGGSDALHQSFGLGGQPVLGVLICIAQQRSEALLDEVRAALVAAAAHETACSQLPGALVCRYLGSSVERAHHAFRAAWAVLRKRCFSSDPVTPRVWLT